MVGIMIKLTISYVVRIKEEMVMQLRVCKVCSYNFVSTASTLQVIPQTPIEGEECRACTYTVQLHNSGVHCCAGCIVAAIAQTQYHILC